MKQKISIIMPCYNHERYISQSIGSVLRQTYTNWELIIVDDGSTDNSVVIIKNYTHKYPDKIKLYTHPNHKNRNLCATYKLGLKKAKGDYLAFLESDDMWDKNALKLRVNILNKYKEVILVYSDVKLFGDSKHWLKNRQIAIKKSRIISNIYKNKPFSTVAFYAFNVIPTFSTVMVRHNAFNGISFAPPLGYEAWLDWWLWAQLSLKGNFFYTPEKTIRWRVHRKSYTYKYSLKINKIKKAAAKRVFLFRKKLKVHLIKILKKRGDHHAVTSLLKELSIMDSDIFLPLLETAKS